MVIKSATVCNDDLIGTFVFLEVFIISNIAGYIHTKSPGNFDINYFICIGEHPNALEDTRNEKKKVT